MLIRRCRSFEIGSDSEGDYKHVTDVGLGVADLARRFHYSLCSRDPLCRDQVSRGAEISRWRILCQLGDVLVSVDDRRIASDCVAIRRDRFC